MLHFDEEARPDWSCWTPSSLHPLGPPHPFIFCSYGLSHGLHQTGAEQACLCPRADFPIFWLRSSKFTCGDFTTALGSSSREGWQRARGVVSSLPETARGSLVPWGGGGGLLGAPPSIRPTSLKSVYAMFIHQSRQTSFFPSVLPKAIYRLKLTLPSNFSTRKVRACVRVCVCVCVCACSCLGRRAGMNEKECF